MRKKKAIRNSIFALLNQVVSVVCAFLLPRLILTQFGSGYNGLVNAISQLLGFAILFQAGISAVAAAAYYKPLADGDTKQISVIFKTTEIFLRKVALSFVIFAFALATTYPFAVRASFDWFYTFTLVLIISAGTFMRFFFGNACSFLINADQLQFITSLVSIVSTIASTYVSIVIINSGYGIRETMLGSAFVLVISPLILNFAVKKRYKIDTKAKPDNSLIKERWSAFWQQVANFLCTNTDIILLTLLSTVYEVSVYSVYNLVAAGLISVFSSITAGSGAAFGNMIAKGEEKILRNRFVVYEELINIVSCFMFTVAAIMIVPFVMLYTKGVYDADYYRESFAFVLCLSALLRCLRFPYHMLANSAGLFKLFQKQAFIEVVINAVLSLALVKPLGILGVIIGTLVAYSYRTMVYGIYISKNIIAYGLPTFLKRIMVTLSLFNGIFFAYKAFITAPISNFVEWVIRAALVSAVTLTMIIVAELLFFRKEFFGLVRMVISPHKK